MAFCDIDNVRYRQGKDGRVFILHPRYRFEPVSMGLMIGGSIMSAYGQYQQGQAASAEAKYNAQLQEREAQAIEQRTRLEQMREAEGAARRRGTMLAGLGASGAVTTAGAPLALLIEQARQDETEQLMIGYQGREQAAASRAGAAMSRMKAKNARTAGTIGAGATLLHGFGTAYQQR